MSQLSLEIVNQKLKEYSENQSGSKPLYIIVSPSDGDRLLKEVQSSGNYDQEEFVTSYKGSKIVKHDVVHPGEIQLSNELPETSS